MGPLSQPLWKLLPTFSTEKVEYYSPRSIRFSTEIPSSDIVLINPASLWISTVCPQGNQARTMKVVQSESDIIYQKE